MPLHTYKPSDVIVTFAGLKLSGFAEDEFVSVDPTEAAFTMKSGIDGAASRSQSGNNTGNVTITLMQTSESNKLLSGFLNIDKLTGEGVKPLSIKDKSGGDSHFSPLAFVEAMPPTAYQKEVGERSWVFQCADLDSFIAGSAPIT